LTAPPIVHGMLIPQISSTAANTPRMILRRRVTAASPADVYGQGCRDDKASRQVTAMPPRSRLRLELDFGVPVAGLGIFVD
jgi:hypothetical protein